MKHDEQKALLQFLKKRIRPNEENITPAQWSWRMGYNKAIEDMTNHIANQLISQSVVIQK